jgi:hypothetical protein
MSTGSRKKWLESPLDIYPQKIGQEEDRLTEANAKFGFVDTHSDLESHSAAPVLNQRIESKVNTIALTSFSADILSSISILNKIPQASTFKPPGRILMNDMNREAWIKDLAGADKSLRELSKNVPLHLKSERLLEDLITNRVPLVRACWLIKVVGLDESNALV